jgi:hypothetical protein
MIRVSNLAGLRMTIFRQRGIDADERIEAVEVGEALAMRARHRRVHFGDHATRPAQDRRRKIHGHAKADEAARIRRGNLKQGEIDRQPSAGRINASACSGRTSCEPRSTVFRLPISLPSAPDSPTKR